MKNKLVFAWQLFPKIQILLFFFLIQVSVSFSQDFWRSLNGPGGGYVQCMAVNKFGHLFAGLESEAQVIVHKFLFLK